MIVPIRCFSCNHLIANLYEFYIRTRDAEREKEERNKTNKTTTIEDITIDENDKNNDTGEIHFDQNYCKKALDACELDRMCCRRTMLTCVDLIDHI